MRKVLFLLVALSIFLHSAAYGMSMTGLKSSGIIGPNTHTHVTTSPSRVYAMTVTPTVNSGFAQIIETQTTLQDTTDADSHYVSGLPARADIQSATAGNTIHAEFPDGINIAGQMFVDTRDALVEIYYKE